MHNFKKANLTVIKSDLRNIKWADLLHCLRDIKLMWSKFCILLKILFTITVLLRNQTIFVHNAHNLSWYS